MLKITSLIENISSCENLFSEHGLSLFIQKDTKCFLLDTGETDGFIHNAAQLGIDLTVLDAAIISHNHYDHIGGLEHLFKMNKNAQVYIKSAAKSAFYVEEDNDYIAINEKDGLFEAYSGRITFFEENVSLEKDVFLLSNSIPDKSFFCQDHKLLEKKNGCYIPDEFKHELFMTIDTLDGLVIISSCSHNGIVNIVSSALKKFPGRKISHVIGGLHMMAHGDMNGLNCSEEYVANVAKKLLSTGVENLHICHCTGLKAFELLKEQMGDRVSYFKTGETILSNA